MNELDLLLCEDSKTDAHFITRILKKESLTENYHWVADGAEVLDYLLEEKNPLPKVIILDIKMPRLNGFEVLARLKKEARTSKIPVVMYSSSDQLSDIDTAYSLGASSYLNKPMKFRDMTELFKSICHYWLNANRTIFS